MGSLPGLIRTPRPPGMTLNLKLLVVIATVALVMVSPYSHSHSHLWPWSSLFCFKASDKAGMTTRPHSDSSVNHRAYAHCTARASPRTNMKVNVDDPNPTDYFLDLSPFHRLPRGRKYDDDLTALIFSYVNHDHLVFSLAKSNDWIRYLDVVEVVLKLRANADVHGPRPPLDMGFLLQTLIVAISRVKNPRLESAREEFLPRLIRLNSDIDDVVLWMVGVQFLVREMKALDRTIESETDQDRTERIRSKQLTYSRKFVKWMREHENILAIVNRWDTYTYVPSLFCGYDDFFERGSSYSFMYEETWKVCRELLPYKMHYCTTDKNYSSNNNDNGSSLVAILSILRALVIDTAGMISVASCTGQVRAAMAAAMTCAKNDDEVCEALSKLLIEHMYTEEACELNAYLHALRAFAQGLNANKAKEQIVSSTNAGSADQESKILFVNILKGKEMMSIESECTMMNKAIDSLSRLNGLEDKKPSNLVDIILRSVNNNCGKGPDHRRMLIKVHTLGDGDFSFSRALVNEWGVVREGKEEGSEKGQLSLVATTLLSKSQVVKTYKAAEPNINFLEMCHHQVMYQVDATAPALINGNDHDNGGDDDDTTADFIIFNFPYANVDSKASASNHGNNGDEGKGKGEEKFDTHHVAIGRHQRLLRGLFDAFTSGSIGSSSTAVKRHTKLLVTVLLSQSREWGLTALAASRGLQLVDVVAFSHEKHRFHGYTQLRTAVDAKFSQSKNNKKKGVLDAWTFVFQQASE